MSAIPFPELERLERAARRVILWRRRRLTLAALVNFLWFGRWPGEAPYRPADPE